jgi:hypothetical protein
MGRRRKKLVIAGVEFTGTLAQPIDETDLIMPLGHEANSPEFQKWVDAAYDRRHRLQIQKMPELARQLGMQVEKFDLTTHAGLMVFYGQLALNLALKLGIPGFLEAEPKWPRAVVRAVLEDSELRRQRGEPNPDLKACLIMVRGLDPDLQRSGRKTAAIRRAKTLRNQVSKLRQSVKREQAEKLAAQPSNVVRLSRRHKIKPEIL